MSDLFFVCYLSAQSSLIPSFGWQASIVCINNYLFTSELIAEAEEKAAVCFPSDFFYYIFFLLCCVVFSVLGTILNPFDVDPFSRPMLLFYNFWYANEAGMCDE